MNNKIRQAQRLVLRKHWA